MQSVSSCISTTTAVAGMEDVSKSSVYRQKVPPDLASRVLLSPVLRCLSSTSDKAHDLRALAGKHRSLIQQFCTCLCSFHLDRWVIGQLAAPVSVNNTFALIRRNRADWRVFRACMPIGSLYRSLWEVVIGKGFEKGKYSPKILCRWLDEPSVSAYLTQANQRSQLLNWTLAEGSRKKSKTSFPCPFKPAAKM